MNTINEDYVSFEVARLLKEKGFDEKCQKVYMHNGQLLWASIFMEGESFVDNECIEDVANYNDWITYTQGEYAYLCPTLQMACKWLRETYNKHCDVGYDIDLEWYFQIIDLKEIVEYDYPETKKYHAENETGFKIYEEAVEAAIKYVLENLI